MNSVIRTIVVDDHPLYRGGVTQILSAEDDIEVIGEGACTQDAYDLVERDQPCLVLMDISMPGDGLASIIKIKEIGPAVRIAMLTASEDDKDISSALGNGADGYIVKGVGGDELVTIVRRLAAGEPYVSPMLAGRKPKSERNAAIDDGAVQIATLTKREEDILRHVTRGLTNKEVAITLRLQEKTIKHYMTTILQKLCVRNRVEAALLAHQYWGEAA